MEGVIPAIESAHAVAYAMKLAPTLPKDKIIVICLSGRGDKDVAAIARYKGGLISMTRLTDAFKNKKAFIPFVTAGDGPIHDGSPHLCHMEEAGASVIELGIPFSDPVAEGPVIQEADNRALAAGFRIDALFDLLEKVREKDRDPPLVFLTYANPIFTYGREAFFTRCAKASIDGVIVPDVPFEGKGNSAAVCPGKGDCAHFPDCANFS